MHYKFYATEDFIQDEFFQQWIFFPNEERNHYWTTFLAHYPGQRKKVDEAREFLLAMNFDQAVSESVVQKIKNDFNSAIDEYELTEIRVQEPAKLPPAPPEKRVSFKVVISLAASLLMAGLLFGYSVMQKDYSTMLFPSLALEEQKSQPGSQRHVVLADGSEVWLNADSKIRYPKDFLGKNIREVYLEGEAYFDIVRNVEKPFIVHTSELAIEVLGTAFNVRSYATDREVETTLVSGKVTIAPVSGDTNVPVTLLPNQQALYRKDTKILARADTVHIENYIAWKKGWMVFDNRAFSFIKQTMERWYDVNIHMEDETSLSCTYSGKFKDKTLQEVLEIFKSTAAINYRIEGKEVFIGGRLCQYERSN